MEIRKYKIKGLEDNHQAQADFDLWMNQKVCPICGTAWKTFFHHAQECSSCHSRKPFIERYKYYEQQET